MIRNVHAHFGRGSAEFSNGLPHDADTARQFFDRSLRGAWIAPHDALYDFLVQSPTWRLGAISIAVLRRQFDRTYLTVTFVSRAIQTLGLLSQDRHRPCTTASVGHRYAIRRLAPRSRRPKQAATRCDAK
ncbi:hypothetical protein AS156_27480 [Bradyrhizobium macuxiense]|uniref:Uncharacterized protein n=1 Tax=Bradyrhizobium macuxiense TaxID=1755647 RepID=A0A109K4R6_9BRAD|nr:hypothetical protein [Bradyrhizobium macuxiense]KWV60789.1 hypothetical protein AS156_27480 [Bradyrhizobium macuxiense]